MYRTIGAANGPVLAALGLAMTPFKAKKHSKTLSPYKPPAPTPATSNDELQQMLTRLGSKKNAWVALGCKERAKLLRECVKNTVEVYEEAAAVGAQAKGIFVGEEMLVWTSVVGLMREMAEAMDAGGQPKPHAVRTLPSGQQVVDVFPLGIEAVMFAGFKADLWILPGHAATQGKLYRDKQEGRGHPGAVSLVLGAGNQVSVVAGDILHKLILEDEVVICKMNPVNDYYGPYLRRCLMPLVKDGFVEFAYGGLEQGKFLTEHPSIESIHLTGSSATYDAVVWGSTAKHAGEPPCKKRVTAELGCVTPYIIVPGTWSQADLEYHADSIVTGKTQNSGHNCIAAEIIVTAQDWPQREAFVDAIRRRLDKEPRRPAFYPGSDKRFAAFQDRFSSVEKHGYLLEGGDEATAQPWLFQTGLLPEQAELDTEHWCGVLQEVAIPATGSDPEAFMQQAVSFANDKVWGTLSCTMIVPPQVQRAHKAAFEQAIADLQYGSVCINVPSMMGFATGRGVWGGFPGHTPQDIRSGNCFVHNTLLMDHPQKCVVYGPWRLPITPFWSTERSNLVDMAKGTITFFANPSLGTMGGPAIAGLLG